MTIGGAVAGALFLLIAYVVVSALRRRWRAEASLRESEGRFRAAFETAAHGMGLMSTDGRFLKINRSLCRMVGCSGAELRAADFQTTPPSRGSLPKDAAPSERRPCFRHATAAAPAPLIKDDDGYSVEQILGRLVERAVHSVLEDAADQAAATGQRRRDVQRGAGGDQKPGLEPRHLHRSGRPSGQLQSVME
ncbi:PAS domain S-box protein [Azospirillum sp.]|uniref:PAS domain S-box protein n=1 Tax=Azospirillum sp. TaxID=34012 RepID=UPI003D70CF59